VEKKNNASGNVPAKAAPPGSLSECRTRGRPEGILQFKTHLKLLQKNRYIIFFGLLTVMMSTVCPRAMLRIAKNGIILAVYKQVANLAKALIWSGFTNVPSLKIIKT